MKIERNSLCSFGSGKKYKKCCLTLERKPTQVFSMLSDPTYEPAQQNRENILQLKEGEESPFIMGEVSYYKEKLESEGKKAQKPRALTCSSPAIGYVPLS